MIYIEPPEYTYEQSPVFNSDVKRINRVWNLFGLYTTENNFDLAAGIFGTKLLSGGSNERRSHAMRYPYRQALHAEQVAIMSARTSVEGLTIYVCRYTGNEFLLAKPCFWCMHTLLREKIARVVFTTGDPAEPIHSFKTSTVDIEPISSLDIDYQLIS